MTKVLKNFLSVSLFAALLFVLFAPIVEFDEIICVTTPCPHQYPVSLAAYWANLYDRTVPVKGVNYVYAAVGLLVSYAVAAGLFYWRNGRLWTFSRSIKVERRG